MAEVTFTRPANTTPYDASDVVGAALAALEFVGALSPGRTNLIIEVSLEVDVASVPAGMGAFRLHLYSVTPPSALADGAAFNIPAGDRAAYQGYIDLTVPIDRGDTLFVQNLDVRKAVKAVGTSLFAYLETVAGYTPTSAAVKKLTLNATPL